MNSKLRRSIWVLNVNSLGIIGLHIILLPCKVYLFCKKWATPGNVPGSALRNRFWQNPRAMLGIKHRLVVDHPRARQKKSTALLLLWFQLFISNNLISPFIKCRYTTYSLTSLLIISDNIFKKIKWLKVSLLFILFSLQIVFFIYLLIFNDEKSILLKKSYH